MTLDQMTAELTTRFVGPHADRHTAAAASLAAAAMRFLNYATGPHAAAGLTEPATIDIVTGNLAAAAHGLPQLCDQLTRWLTRWLAAGQLADDHGQPELVTTEVVRDQLAKAASLAADLGAALSAAQAAAGHLIRPEREYGR